MSTIQQPISVTHYRSATKTSIFKKFFAWCNEQEKNRLLWLAAMITGHGCLFTPITGLMITLSGNSFILWPFAIAAMGMCLVTNLAALPTKITIPVFFLSLLIDFAIIVNCIAVLISVS